MIMYHIISIAPPCTENAVRLLVNRTQICHKRKWGYVCGDSDWTSSNNGASVACSEVKLRPEGRCCISKTFLCQCRFVCPHSGAKSLIYNISAFFPYILSHVNCNGSEKHLINCSHRVLYNLDCSFVAEAFCAGRSIYVY